MSSADGLAVVKAVWTNRLRLLIVYLPTWAWLPDSEICRFFLFSFSRYQFNGYFISKIRVRVKFLILRDILPSTWAAPCSACSKKPAFAASAVIKVNSRTTHRGIAFSSLVMFAQHARVALDSFAAE